jgi:hypothetical protein
LTVFDDGVWKWAQRLLIVGAALALVGCVTVARWLFGAA